jgi:hypothetical protein
MNPASGLMSQFDSIDASWTQPGELEIGGRPGLSTKYDVLGASA